MKAKRILALLGVIVLVGLYLMTLVFAFMKNAYSMHLFIASIAATIAIPLMIHLFLMINNVRHGKKVFDNPYSYRDSDSQNKK